MSNLYQRVQALLRRYGRLVNLRRANGAQYTVYAYIQPFRHENRQYLDDLYSPIGYRDQNAFLYLGQPEDGGEKLAAGDLVYDCGQAFLVSTCEAQRVENTVYFMRAILRRAHEEEEPCPGS